MPNIVLMSTRGLDRVHYSYFSPCRYFKLTPDLAMMGDDIGMDLLVRCSRYILLASAYKTTPKFAAHSPNHEPINSNQQEIGIGSL